MRRQLVLAAVCSFLAASCGASTPGVRQPAQDAKTACVRQDNSSFCGLVPPTRLVDAGTAYKVTTVLGESFWVILPDELTPTVPR